MLCSQCFVNCRQTSRPLNSEMSMNRTTSYLAFLTLDGGVFYDEGEIILINQMSSPPKGGNCSKQDKKDKPQSKAVVKSSASPVADGEGRPGPSTATVPAKMTTSKGVKKEGREESSGTTASSTSTPVAHNNNNQTVNQKDGKKDKSCCFCWCCCCSCSCLSVHNQMKEKSNKMHQISGPGDNLNGNGSESPPTLEEIRSWGESFDRLMRNANGRRVFRDFLRCEYSEENILFWLACEDLKRERNPELVEEKARSIYEDYVSILSPKEVSLDSKVREIVNRNMKNPTSSTFDDAQLQIYTLMHRDSYPRFLSSPQYRRLAQLSPPTPPTRKTSISVG